MKITTEAVYAFYKSPVLDMETKTFTIQEGVIEIPGRVTRAKVNRLIPIGATLVTVEKEILTFDSVEDYTTNNPSHATTRPYEF